jgi:methionyl-tRNA formyltransferase
MMRILFAGSPHTAVEPLRSIREAGFDIVRVFSQPARPVGRKKVLTPTAVTAAAQEWGLEVSHPTNSEELVALTEEARADVAIAVAYGRMIPLAALALPTHGWWNLHFSLLPRWRGATPVQHALLHGDAVTGVSVFQMDEGLDTGPLLATTEHKVRALDTAETLLSDLSIEGAQVLVSLLKQLDAGPLPQIPQVGEPSYAPKLTREDGRLNWSKSVREVENRFRAVTPEPGAHTTLAGSDRSIGITQLRTIAEDSGLAPGELSVVSSRVLVGCGDGSLEVVRLKPAGKTEMTALDWWRGVGAGARFE